MNRLMMTSVTALLRLSTRPVRIITLPFLLLNGIVFAGNTNDPPQSTKVSVLCWSPSRDYYVEQHTMYPSELMKVWVVSAKNPKERQLIYAHSRSVEVIFSDGDDWLAINDHACSNSSDVILFRHRRSADYRKVGELGVNAWKFFAKQTGRKDIPLLDHNYVDLLRWTDDHTMLINIYGHADNRNYVEDWLCLYDVRSKTFTTDFDKHNKGHVTLKPE